MSEGRNAEECAPKLANVDFIHAMATLARTIKETKVLKNIEKNVEEKNSVKFSEKYCEPLGLPFHSASMMVVETIYKVNALSGSYHPPHSYMKVVHQIFMQIAHDAAFGWDLRERAVATQNKKTFLGNFCKDFFELAKARAEGTEVTDGIVALLGEPGANGEQVAAAQAPRVMKEPEMEVETMVEAKVQDAQLNQDTETEDTEMQDVDEQQDTEVKDQADSKGTEMKDVEEDKDTEAKVGGKKQMRRRKKRVAGKKDSGIEPGISTWGWNHSIIPMWKED